MKILIGYKFNPILSFSLFTFAVQNLKNYPAEDSQAIINGQGSNRTSSPVHSLECTLSNNNLLIESGLNSTERPLHSCS